MMVILEMLSRAYSDEHEIEVVSGDISVDSGAVHKMAVEAYERGLGMYRSIEYKDLIVAEVDEIPDGERKIVQIDNRSIGIFHHNKNGLPFPITACTWEGRLQPEGSRATR